MKGTMAPSRLNTETTVVTQTRLLQELKMCIYYFRIEFLLNGKKSPYPETLAGPLVEPLKPLETFNLVAIL